MKINVLLNENKFGNNFCSLFHNPTQCLFDSVHLDISFDRNLFHTVHLLYTQGQSLLGLVITYLVMSRSLKLNYRLPRMYSESFGKADDTIVYPSTRHLAFKTMPNFVRISQDQPLASNFQNQVCFCPLLLNYLLFPSQG